MSRPADLQTRCMIRARTPGQGDLTSCPFVAHVVLFATRAGEFAGREYRRGEHILACLKHADHIVTARRNANGRFRPPTGPAAWLEPYALAGLPASKLAEHNEPVRMERPAHRDRRSAEGQSTPPRERVRARYERA